MSDVAAAGKVVIINYTLTNDAGEVLDTSDGGEALPYLHGSGNIVEGLEEVLNGQPIGFSTEVSVAPEKGYGLRQEGDPQPVPRSAFPPDAPLQEGMQFLVETDDGVAPVWIVGVEPEHVLLDGNHPLAGETLHFKAEIIGVRDATEDEKAHGHPHGLDGTGGHHH
ncbi:MAG: peptidylprolyl isomerase [Deltaproteobacteria bacterium]|nr:peptidylprolyl isomerase [Deltaproteobacteria bacterium]